MEHRQRLVQDYLFLLLTIAIVSLLWIQILGPLILWLTWRARRDLIGLDMAPGTHQHHMALGTIAISFFATIFLLYFTVRIACWSFISCPGMSGSGDSSAQFDPTYSEPDYSTTARTNPAFSFSSEAQKQRMCSELRQTKGMPATELEEAVSLCEASPVEEN